MLVNIANYQAESADVAIVMINDLYDDNIVKMISPKVKFINIGRPVGSKNPWWFLKFNMKLLQLSADIYHVHLSPIFKVLFPNFKKRTVFTMHHIIIGDEWKTVSKINHICAISQAVHDNLLTYNINSVVVENGIVTKDFYTNSRNSSSTVNIVQVGRLDHSLKGQDLLIEACYRLRCRGVSNFTLDIIGDGDSFEFLNSLILKYNCGDIIHLTGVKSQKFLRSHLGNYDLFVQPSRLEGFGLTIAEAMAAKVPVLVSNHEGPMEIIESGNYGFFFENDNIESLVNILERLIANRQLREQFVEDAYKHVCEEYDVRKTAENYIAQYENISAQMSL